jgi:hypothetical protein
MRYALFALMLLPSFAAAQERVVVTDSLGNRVAFAWVQLKSGIARAADDSGRVTVDATASDSLQLTVRRIGYAPFDGRVARDAALDAYRVIINPLPQALERINIVAPRENRLFRNGFYTRQEEAWKIGTPSRFLSPEAIEARPATRASQLLSGISFITIQRESGKPFLMGRGRCPVTVLLDGRRAKGMVEEISTREGELELLRIAQMMPPSVEQERRVPAARREFIADRVSIDDLVNPGSVAAIEAYASANQAPIEFRNEAMNPTCALVAVWTGSRQ